MIADVVIAALALDPGRIARCAALLSADETARADRFLREADRTATSPATRPCAW